MHETALMAQLLRRVEQEARAAGAARVKAVRLRVGELSGVEPRLLESAFDWLAPGTVADGARLEIEPVPLEASCEACGRRFRVEQFHFRCPACGGDRTRAVAGEELVLEGLSVEGGRGPAGAIAP
jgi:hydrogenase nickel incorporation protein HypA/HybF